MSTERYYFLSEARQEKTIDFFDESRKGMVLIRFQLYKLLGSGWIDGDAYDDVPVARDVAYEESPIWTESYFWISLSSLKHLPSRKKHTELFSEVLEEWNVPKPQQPAILAQLFQVVDGAAPELPIIVAVRSLTLRLRIVTSFGYEVTELNPTAESSTFIEDDLEKVKVDSLGAMEHKTTSSCVLCMEGFYDSDNGVQQLTCLPCSHPYHGRCLVQWPSEISRSCPSCEKPKSKFHACRQFWLGMVRKHAGTMISALIFCQFFKQTTLQVQPLETTPAPPKNWKQSLLEVDEMMTMMATKLVNDFQSGELLKQINKKEWWQFKKECETKWSQTLEKKEVHGSEATIAKDRNPGQMVNNPRKGKNRQIYLFRPFSFVK